MKTQTIGTYEMTKKDFQSATKVAEIRALISAKMHFYSDSRQPTGDEVTIAWLLTEVERLGIIREEQAQEISRLESALRNAQSY